MTRECTGVAVVDDDQPYRRVIGHEREAFRRVRRIERHVRRTGAQDGEQDCDGLGGAPHQHPNPVTLGHAGRDQPAGKAGRQVIELPVGERRVFGADGDVVRLTRGNRRERAIDRPHGTWWARRPAQGKDFVPLRRGQDPHVPDEPFG